MGAEPKTLVGRVGGVATIYVERMPGVGARPLLVTDSEYGAPLVLTTVQGRAIASLLVIASDEADRITPALLKGEG